jgi:paired amphipathic helix protein Sin3a
MSRYPESQTNPTTVFAVCTLSLCRALPKNYPKAKCTERIGAEAKVLNDIWVSIPIGSEESYSFKHMRKNQYEEALFKCEDERFEIDMVIDSNMSTIRTLEPLYEELCHIKQMHRGESSLHALSTVPTVPRVSIQLDKRQLSTIHLNSIARIYGDHAEEVLELLKRNPAATIPVVLKRLKQKDVEWRKARTELNRHWKDVLCRNHAKSFDHRSFYFKQQDKKYLSTKQLVADLTGRAACAWEGQEHVQCATTGAAKTPVPAAPSANEDIYSAGLATTVPAAVQPGLQGLLPQLLLVYEHDCAALHQDIYALLIHAAEHTLPAAAHNDKERVAALYRDLLRVFFQLPTHFLYPQHAGAAAAGGAAGSAGDCALPQEESFPIGSRVLTHFGSGTVLAYRPSVPAAAAEGMYSVQLAYGTAHLAASCVLGAEELSLQALQAIGVSRDESTGQDRIFGISDDTSRSSSSSGAADHATGGAAQQQVFFGTQMCYIFFRLHHLLYVRLRMARQLAAERQQHGSGEELDAAPAAAPSGEPETAEGVHAGSASDAGLGCAGHNSSYNVYSHFLSQLYVLLEGSSVHTGAGNPQTAGAGGSESSRYEDLCRGVLGNKAYVLYTLDKVITQLLKHLQAMASDDNVSKLIGLFV